MHTVETAVTECRILVLVAVNVFAEKAIDAMQRFMHSRTHTDTTYTPAPYLCDDEEDEVDVKIVLNASK